MEDLLARQSSNTTSEACPHPFLFAVDYPYVAGQKNGRLCTASFLDPKVECCLPCPLTEWVFPDDFKTVSSGASWLSIWSVVCCVFIFVSFAVLPPQRTSRHYLTIGLVVAVFLLSLAFVIPLGSKPDQCYDAITPNNMLSDLSCAFTGSLLLFGGFGAVMWVFVRSLSVHLQICWKIVPAEMFFYLAQVGGWGVTALLTGLSLGFSGVSYRLGGTCHLNHEDSGVATFWGPLLAFSTLALFIQLATFAYCLRVYLSVANGPKGMPSSNNSALATQQTGSSGRSQVVKRATYRRVRKVFALHWRGMTVVMIVVITACYLATVFLILDRDLVQAFQNSEAITPWVFCLVESNGNKNACLSLTSNFVLNERLLLAVLYLLAVIGFWCLIFLGKWEIVYGWRDFFVDLFRNGKSSSVRSESQQSFDNRMQATPQQLQLVKSDGVLAVARKSHIDDIEVQEALPPSQPDENDEYYVAKDLESPYYRPPRSAPLPQTTSIGSPTSNHVVFNFSRPTTSQGNQPFSTRPHRSSSSADGSWFMHNPEHSDAIPLSPTVPSRTASRTSDRPSAGMAWIPSSTFAPPHTAPLPHPQRSRTTSPAIAQQPGIGQTYFPSRNI